MNFTHRTARRGFVSGLTLAALLFSWACGGSDRLSPNTEAPPAVPATSDSIAGPIDSSAVDTLAVAPDSTLIQPDSLGITAGPATAASALGTQPGIVFGSYSMAPSNLNTVHTGTLRGGGISETNVLSFLSAIRAKGGRMVLKMCMGEDKYVKNPDGTFSFTKWKALVDRFRKVNLGPYISDGTLMGHFLIDEPQRTKKWGGKIIPQSTIEAMAQYSKSIWPTLPTLVRVVPSWLVNSSVTFSALDAGWLQYSHEKGDAATLAAYEVSKAKQKGLGLVIGLNVLDGGNGSSGMRGWSSGRWAMSATEIKNYGSALLNQTYACGFFNWAYLDFGPTYYARSDIKTAMATVSSKARLHARTSCRQ